MADELTGGCQCGAIAYRARLADSRTVTHCHCRMCRKLTGGSFVTWVEAPADGFVVTKGKPRRLQSSAFAERFFCGDCGCHIAFRYWEERAEIVSAIWISAGSLDHPEQITPTDVIFAREMLPWMPDDPRLRHWPGQISWLGPEVGAEPAAAKG
jgi:hypothetical protein